MSVMAGCKWVCRVCRALHRQSQCLGGYNGEIIGPALQGIRLSRLRQTLTDSYLVRKNPGGSELNGSLDIFES